VGACVAITVMATSRRRQRRPARERVTKKIRRQTRGSGVKDGQVHSIMLVVE
jgi:hypothetical protein